VEEGRSRALAPSRNPLRPPHDSTLVKTTLQPGAQAQALLNHRPTSSTWIEERRGEIVDPEFQPARPIMEGPPLEGRGCTSGGGPPPRRKAFFRIPEEHLNARDEHAAQKTTSASTRQPPAGKK